MCAFDCVYVYLYLDNEIDILSLAHLSLHRTRFSERHFVLSVFHSLVHVKLGDRERFVPNGGVPAPSRWSVQFV